ncbi:MAG: TIGR03617 family F420-dependent LLM class oxidoreductase [Candidatus Lambdaproteobacteria bacterium]|nr:TIGR03617 family F420-dependent LLM class oxidoreductase [Candidatus Lambdaproteobacteria bacterium]
MLLDAQLGGYALAQVTAEAERLERIGYDGLWSVETSSNPFLPLALAAQATRRVQIGSNVAIAFARTPFVTATVAWDLQKLSGGRLALGLGTSSKPHLEGRFSTESARPVGRIVDYIRCMRAIWDNFQHGTAPDYEGEFYRFKLNVPLFNPGPIEHPRIPVYVAGTTPSMCRAAGAVADGFNVAPFHTAAYLRDVLRPAIEQGARKHGRSLGDVTISAPVMAVMGDTDEQMAAAETNVRRMIATYCTMPPYVGMLRHHGYDGLHEQMAALAAKGDAAGMIAAVPAELVRAVALVGRPLALAPLLRERYQGLADRVSLRYAVPGAASEPTWSAFVGAFKGA